MTLTDLSIQYDKLTSGGRFLESPSLPFRERIGLNFGVDFTSFLFMRHNVHGATTVKQFAWVGWEFQLGVRPFNWLEIGYRHHSQHALDQPGPNSRFPVEDGVSVRVIIFDEGLKR